MKTCTKCSEGKSYDNYYKSKNIKDGYTNECKSCIKITLEIYNRSIKGLVTKMYSHHKIRNRDKFNSNIPYTKEEFKKWITSNNNFEELYKNWVDSEYDKMLKPSCDRLDDYKGYSLENIRLVTWKENCDKYYSDSKSGINTKTGKTVVQYSLFKSFIKEFHSISSASRDTGIGKHSISKACNGTQEHAGGCIWKFKQ